jgi:imidazolonepropionase-like amidohydrolase
MNKNSLVLTGGTLFDGTGALPIPNSTIIITGSQITAVGPSEEVKIPKEAKIIRVKGKTVIPSFIDSHTHFIIKRVRNLGG